MTILFLADWTKHPSAILHTTTRNQSFVRMVEYYRQQGIQNHSFMLALHNPSLAELDPFAKDLTVEQKAAILIEARDNLWYFLRECVRHPDPLTGMNRFEANRGNLAAWWAWVAGLDVAWQQTRQTQKNTSVNALVAWLITIQRTNTSVLWGVKDDMLRRHHALDLSEMVRLLPPYFDLRSPADEQESHRHEDPVVNIGPLHNQVRYLVAQATVRTALNLGRGSTANLLILEDMPFFRHIESSFPNMVAASTAMRLRAEQSEQPAGFLIHTTAGKPSTPEGQYTRNLFTSMSLWDDSLFDMSNREDLHFVTAMNAPCRIASVHISFDYKELGFSEEWLNRQLDQARMKRDEPIARREFFNEWAG